MQADDKRRTKGKESRQHILQAAITCISTRGLGKTTLDRVAKGAGVSRALVVFHFKSKNGLLAQVLDFLGVQYSESRSAAIASAGPSTIEKLLHLLEFDVRFACENPGFISTWHAFWGEVKGNSLYHELSAPRDERHADHTRQLLATLIEEGGYDPSELDQIHTGLTAMLFGLWVETHLNPGADDFRKSTAALRLFLHKVFPKHMTNAIESI